MINNIILYLSPSGHNASMKNEGGYIRGATLNIAGINDGRCGKWSAGTPIHPGRPS